MAQISPFKSLLYNQEKVELKKVIMPPYDIIKEKDAGIYYRRDPYNIIRIDKGGAEEGDGERNNRYTRASDMLGEWMLDGVIVPDETESFYVHTQEYRLPGGGKKEMTGFFAAVKLEEFDKKIVLPHERTHSGPKQDRLELMRATHANTSPILSLYIDRDKKVHVVIKKAMKAKPFINVTGYDSLKSRMWKITSEGDVKKIRGLFKNKLLFIADGHHRYETAINYRDEMRKKLGTGETPYENIMMCLISMEHSGISILPTHRVFADFRKFDPRSPGILKFFDVKKEASAAALKKAMLKKTAGKKIGIVVKEGCFLLKLKAGKYPAGLQGKEHIRQYYLLSVSILHTLLFGKILGIKEGEILPGIGYTQDIDEAAAAGKKTKKSAAFLLEASTVEEVKTMSLHGEVMPQKSTYFLPKLSTGYLINKMG
jgi:uncharacterized protein (DUF1015 family)